MHDVLNQVSHLERALEYYHTQEYTNILKDILNIKFSKVIFTGMGSSNYASIGASLFLNENGVNSMVISAAQLLYYCSNIIDNETLLIIVSQSGESAEIINLLDKLNKNVNVIGVTNIPESTLALKIKKCLYLNVEKEVTVSSRTYTSTLMVLNLLARNIVHKEESYKLELVSALESLKCFIEEYKNRESDINGYFENVKFISFMGRGPSFGSALAGGLFLKEASKFPCEGTDSAEFRHGPIEVVDKNFGAVVFAPQGKTGDLGIKIARDIAIKEGKVILITDQDNIEENKNIVILKYNNVDEYLSPIIEIAGVQFICNAAAKKLDIIPGEFRWASKITKEE